MDINLTCPAHLYLGVRSFYTYRSRYIKESLPREEDIFVGISRGGAYRILMTDSWKITICEDISFDKSGTVLDKLDEARTSRINFELPGFESKYFCEAVTDNVEGATAEEPDIPAPDFVQESDRSDNDGKTIKNGDIPWIHLHTTMDCAAQHNIPLEYLLCV